jgi:hypothetical protein
MVNDNISPKTEAEKLVCEIAKKEAEHVAEKVEKSFSKPIEEMALSIKSLTEGLQAKIKADAEHLQKQEDLQKKSAVKMNRDFGSVENYVDDMPETLSLKLKSLSSGNSNEQKIIFDTKNDAFKESNTFFQNLYGKQLKQKSTINSFNDKIGGALVSNPVFGGMVDLTKISSARMMARCNVLNGGFSAYVGTRYLKEDASEMLLDTTGMSKTPELTGFKDGKQIKYDQDYITLSAFTEQQKISFEMFGLNQENLLAVDIVNRTLSRIDTKLQKVADSLFFNGNGDNKGCLDYITSNQMLSIETAGSTMTMADLFVAVSEIPESVKEQSGYQLDILVKEKNYIKLLTQLTGGSQEYLNAMYMQQAQFKIGDLVVNIARLPNERFINPNNQTQFQNLKETQTAGDVVALIGSFNLFGTYITSSNVQAGVLALTEDALNNRRRTFFKEVYMGFGIVNPNALVALKVKS